MDARLNIWVEGKEKKGKKRKQEKTGKQERLADL